MAKIKTAAVKSEKKKAGFMQVIAGIWMVAMLAVFPLYFQEAYADMLNAKYGCMLAADGILLGAFLIWVIAGRRVTKYYAEMRSCADPETGRWFGNWFRKTFNLPDIFVLAFLVVVIISTLQSAPYMYSAIFGNEGRWVGTITLVLWCLTFFVASRHFKFSYGYVYAFLIATLIATLWAISDYFDMDILHFKFGIDSTAYAIFVSTIGNIDSYAGFASIPMAFAGILFILSKKGIISRIFFWICFASAAMSMITCSADNAYLSFAVFFAFAPLAAARTRAGIRRYLTALATFVTAMVLVGYLNDRLEGTVVMSGNELVDITAGIPAVRWIAVILWCAAAVLLVYDVIIRKYPNDTPAPRAVHTVWIVILIAGIAGLTAVTIYANVHQDALPEVLIPLKSYLVFSDEWGTWRGYIWKYLLNIYSKLPLIHKIFGAGPETASIYLFNNAYFAVADKTGMMFDTPHNEWLMMLFNLGPFGLLSYLCILISPVIMAFRRSVRKYYPIVLAVGFVCICHLAESFTNITALMELPIVFALLAMAQSLFTGEEYNR